MTRDEAIQKVIDYLVETDGVPRYVADDAFYGNSPMRGCLLMLEALGLVKFDDPPSS